MNDSSLHRKVESGYMALNKKIGEIFSIMGYCIKTMFLMDKRYLFLLSLSVLITSVIPLFQANLVSEVINLAVYADRPANAVIAAGIMLGVLAFLQSLNVYVMWYRSNHYISMGHSFDIMVARKTLDMRYEKAEDPKIAELRMRAAKGCSSVPRIAESITDFSANIIKMVSCAAVFTMFNPLILLVVTPFAALNYFISSYFQKRYYENERKQYRHKRKINYFIAAMLDYVAGKEIRVFSAADFIKNKYCEQEKELYDIEKCTKRYSLADGITGVVIVVVQLLVLYFMVGNEYFGRQAQIGDVILYINLVLVFSGAFSGLFGSFISAGWQGERLKDFRVYMALEDENKQMESVPMTDGITAIEFDHVWFRYSGAEEYTIKDLSVKISSGERLAIVGENGSGKTTLIKLLMRFYVPTKGRILINGVDYLTIKGDDYYSLFSTVFQDFNLTAFTVKENIDFSVKGEADGDKMKAILNKLDMLDKVQRLRSGFDTYLSQEYSAEGINLSGGERQKLAIARAEYKDAPILILDEPTSALDPVAEKKLYDELYHMVEDKTMIMISHRLQSTAMCDRIIFMKNGRIEEKGTHEELIGQKGDYSKMFLLQAGWYLEGQEG